MKKFILRWGPAILWAVIIFTISSIPTLPKTKIIWWDFILKKTAHIIEYGIFYLLIVRALSNITGKQLLPKKVNKTTLLTALILAIIYALSDEYHQSFIIGRTAKLTDVGFDTLGMLISRKLILSRHSGKRTQ